MADKIIFLALVLLAASACAAPRESRMVGGTPVLIEEFPYIVAFTYFYPRPQITIQRCVGSLISSYHVLTSAFCYEGATLSYMLVRAGSTHSLSGGIVSTIREAIKHPNYVSSPRQADIAVTVLNFPLTGSNSIDFLYLPPQNWYIADGQPVAVVSWGFESEQGPQIENLKAVVLNKLPLDDCQEVYADSNYVIIDDPVICASQPGPIGMCLGDSGAPVAIDRVAVGITSYYYGCGDNAYPDVFTRVDRYTDWILEVAVDPRRANVTSTAITDGIRFAPLLAPTQE